MTYYLDLFSPETYEAFTRSNQNVSGFRARQQNAASKIKADDKFICYMTKLSRWIGILEVKSNWYRDDTPLFYAKEDPFVIRFRVAPLAWLDKEKAIPIREDHVWQELSFTKAYNKNSHTWTGKLRSSLIRLDDGDGVFLERLILSQIAEGETFPIDEERYRKLTTPKVVRRPRKIATTPTQDIEPKLDADELTEMGPHSRESIKIQALLADIGMKMGKRVWIPRNDRSRVLAEYRSNLPQLLDKLPANMNEETLKTVEQIDVLWLEDREIVRAFEVEHTTAIYSGILRMADLLALQPNTNIRLHIVAPSSRREAVFQELRRPAFSLFRRGKLSAICTYLSYESVRELSSQPKFLAHMSDSVLDDLAEKAE